MRFWFGGPRIMGIRTGASFGPEDFRRRERAYSAAASASADVGSFIYVIAGDHGLTKIGVSSNPNARLAQLKTASPYPLRFALICAVSGDAYLVESAAHDLLARQRMDGEWFDVTPELAMSAVTGAASKVGLKLQPVDASHVDRVISVARNTTPEPVVDEYRWWPLWVSLPIAALVLIPFWLLLRANLELLAVPYMAVICALSATPILLGRRPGTHVRAIVRWFGMIAAGLLGSGIIAAFFDAKK